MAGLLLIFVGNSNILFIHACESVLCVYYYIGTQTWTMAHLPQALHAWVIERKTPDQMKAIRVGTNGDSVVIPFSHSNRFELNDSMVRKIIISFYRPMEWIFLVRISLSDFYFFIFSEKSSAAVFIHGVSWVVCVCLVLYRACNFSPFFSHSARTCFAYTLHT